MARCAYQHNYAADRNSCGNRDAIVDYVQDHVGNTNHVQTMDFVQHVDYSPSHVSLQSRMKMSPYTSLGLNSPPIAHNHTCEYPVGIFDDFLGLRPRGEWLSATTVMLRNIPNRYSRDMLLAELDRTHFCDKLDFIYLPIDSSTSSNRGYAFINFLSPEVAYIFWHVYHGKRWIGDISPKIAFVTISNVQGLEANAELHNTGALFFRSRPLTPGQRESPAPGRHGEMQCVDRSALFWACAPLESGVRLSF